MGLYHVWGSYYRRVKTRRYDLASLTGLGYGNRFLIVGLLVAVLKYVANIWHP